MNTVADVLRIPARLRPHVRDTDRLPRTDEMDICPWDEVRHIDQAAPIAVVVAGEPYGEKLGLMCRKHYLAVVESRGIGGMPEQETGGAV
jgi:hypothetical protein